MKLTPTLTYRRGDRRRYQWGRFKALINERYCGVIYHRRITLTYIRGRMLDENPHLRCNFSWKWPRWIWNPRSRNLSAGRLSCTIHLKKYPNELNA